MNILHECTTEEKCSYLDNATQTTQYKIINNCSSDYCSSLIEKGWRRFGNMFFRPVCADCHACESFKIDVANYNFSKSERRTLRKNDDLKIVIQRPQVTSTHLELFEKYHLHMKDKREWTHHEVTPRHYYTSFVNGHESFGYEVLYFLEDRLIAIDLIDVLDEGISSIYFYYDPEFSNRSLGTFSMLQQIQMAQEAELKWIYMGYYVKGCQSLEYKSRFKPYYVLQGRPWDTHVAQWIPSDEQNKEC